MERDSCLCPSPSICSVSGFPSIRFLHPSCFWSLLLTLVTSPLLAVTTFLLISGGHVTLVKLLDLQNKMWYVRIISWNRYQGTLLCRSSILYVSKCSKLCPFPSSFEHSHVLAPSMINAIWSRKVVSRTTLFASWYFSNSVALCINHLPFIILKLDSVPVIFVHVIEAI